LVRFIITFVSSSYCSFTSVDIGNMASTTENSYKKTEDTNAEIGSSFKEEEINS